ncbi:MAG: N-acetyltransferase, partial [Flavonifractor plautii]
SLANAAGRFREGFAYAPDVAALDAFDAVFPVNEKVITDFQQEFQVMCSLGHEVIPNGFMQ